MRKIIKKRSRKAGLLPGSLVHIGERHTEHSTISEFLFSEQSYREIPDLQVQDCKRTSEPGHVQWLNIDGLHAEDLFASIGQAYDLHPLLLEDIMNTDQRPKLDDYGSYMFLVLRTINLQSLDGKQYRLDTEQISIVFGADFVLSFQEKPGDAFDPIRDRIRNAKGKVRKSGSDYLTYALLDAIVDSYFLILERIGERIEDLEADLTENPSRDILHAINGMKKDLILIRKAVWPLREVVGGLQRNESPLVQPATLMYLKDVYDHTVQVIDTVEIFRDLVSGMMDIYLSASSHRLNEVIKVLTILSTIFMPLTFIAGVYGMNFKYMPELEWPYGYFAILGGMAGIAGVMLYIFKKKGWLR